MNLFRKEWPVILIVIFFVALVIIFPPISTAGSDIKIIINSEYFEPSEKPILINSRVMVPMRDILEHLGAEVNWDNDIRTVIATKDDKKITLQIDSRNAIVNGKEIPLESPAMIKNDRTLVPLRFVSETLGSDVYWDEKLRIVYIDNTNVLPTVGSIENLKKLLSTTNDRLEFARGIDLFDRPMSESTKTTEADSAMSNYSQTNIQVSGVDEADIIKTDGKYIYQIRHNTLVISEAYKPESLKVIDTIQFNDKQFNPQELYVDGENLVIIGTSHYMPVFEDEGQVEYRDIEVKSNESATSSKEILSLDRKMILPHYTQVTKALVYKLNDSKNISFSREVEIDGYYATSRKIGDCLYLITNKGMYDGVVPMFRDSIKGNARQEIALDKIHYFPGYIYPNTVSIVSFNLSGVAKEASIKTYLGAGNNIYMSHNNIYIATDGYERTAVFKFNVNNVDVKYSGKAEVSGSVLNQFSMDEHNDYFRIATTSANQTNNVFILDNKMKVVGELTGLAPNERIYSARFIGDKAYLVTFEIIDPLFVIDLKDPKQPKVLGELKIPGFSNYLHPLDENHLLGIGRDTSVRSSDNRQWVIEEGIKLAIFDVSDVNNPIEKHVEIIGDRGTYSEVLYNHKALLFNKNNGIMVLPISIWKSDGSEYGSRHQFTGAYVFNVSTSEGFITKGKITHNNQNMKDDYNKTIKRALYISEYLYTISDDMIKVNKIDSLEHVNTLKIIY